MALLVIQIHVWVHVACGQAVVNCFQSILAIACGTQTNLELGSQSTNLDSGTVLERYVVQSLANLQAHVVCQVDRALTLWMFQVPALRQMDSSFTAKKSLAVNTTAVRPVLKTIVHQPVVTKMAHVK